MICRVLDWNAVSAVSAAVTAVCTLPILIWQVRESQRAAHGQTYLNMLDRLQQAQARQARKCVLGLWESKKPFETWTEKEIAEAEKVCADFDLIGIFVGKKLLRADLVTENWNSSLSRCWSVVQPLVIRERVRRSDRKLWDDFECLAKRCGEQDPTHNQTLAAARETTVPQGGEDAGASTRSG